MDIQNSFYTLQKKRNLFCSNNFSGAVIKRAIASYLL